MKSLFTLLAIACASASGCSSLEPRAAASSYECMQAVRAQLPMNETNDKRLHCLASAKIARQCSVSEAYLAGAGKELRDLVTGGDAEWADWRADRIGVQCSRHVDATAIQACCAAHGD